MAARMLDLYLGNEGYRRLERNEPLIALLTTTQRISNPLHGGRQTRCTLRYGFRQLPRPVEALGGELEVARVRPLSPHVKPKLPDHLQINRRFVDRG